MSLAPLVLLGAGGFARETAELVRALNAVEPTWDLLGFTDDDPALAGATVGGLPVLGSTGWAIETTDHFVVACMASPTHPRRRADFVARHGLAPGRCPTLVHPSATVPGSAVLGAGTVIHAGCVLTADVAVGDHVAVMPLVVITHDDRVGDGVTFGAGVRLAGAVTVEPAAYLGSGCLVREGLTIGAGAVVGMGAVVTRSVPADEVWIGCPARPHHERHPAELIEETQPCPC